MSIRRRIPKGVLYTAVILGTLGLLAAIAFAVLTINNRPPSIHIPTPKMPAVNGYDDFVKAGEMIGKLRVMGTYNGHQIRLDFGPASDPDPSHVWTIPEYEAFMRANAPSLAVFRKGLTKPYLHPPVRGFVFPPMYARFREIARRLRSEAMYYEKIGKPGKAMDSCLDCMELGVMLPRGGSLIAGLVGSAVESIGTNKIVGQTLTKLSPDELEHVAKRLEQIQKKRVPYSDIVLEEGLASTSMYLEMFRDPDVLKSFQNPRSWTQPTPLSFDSKTDFWGNVRFALGNKTVMLRQNLDYYKALASEQRGYYTGKSKTPMPRNMIAKHGMIDNFAFVRVVFTRNEARAALLQTEVALRRYRAANGRYPERLSLLVPKYLKSVTVDPFGQGKPLRYRTIKSGQDFLLYSLGPNMKDDGGKSGKWHGAKTPGDFVAGDY